MKEIVSTVPIIGQKRAPEGPTALFRVRRGGDEVLYCGPNPIDAAATFYALDLKEPTIVCEVTQLQTVFTGAKWEQLLPRIDTEQLT